MAKTSCRKSSKESDSKTASRSLKCRLTTPPDRPRHPISCLARLVVKRIVDIRQAAIRPARGLIALSRTLHVERGSLVVVAVDEVIEPGLLLQEVFGGRFGSLQLQGQMHTLMSAVLLRMAGLDALDLDAEPEPPDG